jgi:chromate transport protein ChrA
MVHPLSEAFRVWSRVAVLSFGGPTGQIAVMHCIIVDEKKWVGESRLACAELLHAAANRLVPARPRAMT